MQSIHQIHTLQYTHTYGRHCIVVYWRILHHVPHVNRNLGRSKDLHWGLDLRLLATRPKETSWTQLTPNRRPKVRPLAVRIRVWLGGTRSAERRVRRVGQLWGGEGDPRFACCGHEVAHDGWSGIHVGNPIPKKRAGNSNSHSTYSNIKSMRRNNDYRLWNLEYVRPFTMMNGQIMPLTCIIIATTRRRHKDKPFSTYTSTYSHRTITVLLIVKEGLMFASLLKKALQWKRGGPFFNNFWHSLCLHFGRSAAASRVAPVENVLEIFREMESVFLAGTTLKLMHF